MARRLSTDAKIVLERAGYLVEEYAGTLEVRRAVNSYPNRLHIKGGTVDNLKLVELLGLNGCDEHGYKRGRK